MEDSASESEVSISVAELTRGLQRKMVGDLATPSSCTIFRIPAKLYRHSPLAYYPDQFSFGPFHYLNEALKQNDKIKFKYLSDLLARCSKNRSKASADPSDSESVLMDLTGAITGVREEARNCYVGPIDNITEEEFIELLVIDGCFIVEVFRKMAYESLREHGDTLFSTSMMLQFLSHDLILLENQVPWMVLQKLFDMTKTTIDNKTLVELAINFCGAVFSIAPSSIEPLANLNQCEHKHILDLLRNSLALSSEVHKLKSDHVMEPVPSAAILEESGIKIRCRDSTSVLDVRFIRRDRVLEIPRLLIHETTETVFRNLISLEQLCPDYDPVFTCYAILLGNLINTAKDVEILFRSGAVVNWLDIQSSEFFNKLFIGSFFNVSYYSELSEDINGHCRSVWPRYRMVLIRHYFNNPWALISISVAIFVAICKFLETYYTIHNHPWAHILLLVAAALVACSFLTTLFKLRK